MSSTTEPFVAGSVAVPPKIVSVKNRVLVVVKPVVVGVSRVSNVAPNSLLSPELTRKKQNRDNK